MLIQHVNTENIYYNISNNYKKLLHKIWYVYLPSKFEARTFSMMGLTLSGLNLSGGSIR